MWDCRVAALPDDRYVVLVYGRPHRSRLFPYTTLFRSLVRTLGKSDFREQEETGKYGRAQNHKPLRSDRKSTRLNSSHVSISYAVFCLKKKTPGTLARKKYMSSPPMVRTPSTSRSAPTM